MPPLRETAFQRRMSLAWQPGRAVLLRPPHCLPVTIMIIRPPNRTPMRGRSSADAIVRRAAGADLAHDSADQFFRRSGHHASEVGSHRWAS